MKHHTAQEASLQTIQNGEGRAADARGLRTYELTIWDRAEHWRFYETVQAASEADARAEFAERFGKGYRLEQVHCAN